MSVRLQDIAKEANVSLATVSKIINNAKGDIRISDATKEKVREVAKKLNYKPNLLARGLRSGKTSLVGVILGNLARPEESRFFQGMEHYFTKSSYGIIVRSAGETKQELENNITFLLDKRIEGLIIFSDLYYRKNTGRLIEGIENQNIPMVLIGNTVPPLVKSTCVGLDDEKAGYMATSHLISLEHKKILCLTNTGNNNIIGIARLNGYKRALSEANIEPTNELIRDLPVSYMPYYDAGYHETKKFIKSRKKFTAVFSHTDRASVGIVRAIKEAGLSIPDNIALVSIDNTEFSEYIDPPLTTLSFDEHRLGSLAAESLCNIISGKNARTQLVEPKLIIRKSCGA